MDELREKNLDQLKMLNTVVFPMRFPVRLGRERERCAGPCWVAAGLPGFRLEPGAWSRIKKSE